MIFAKIIIKITSAPLRVRQSADAIIINQSLRNKYVFAIIYIIGL